MISLDVSIRVITDMSFGVCLIRRYEYGWEKVRELYTHLLHLGVVVVVGYIAARVTWSSGFLKLDERQVIWYRDGGLLFLLVFFLLVLYTARLFAFLPFVSTWVRNSLFWFGSCALLLSLISFETILEHIFWALDALKFYLCSIRTPISRFYTRNVFSPRV